MYDFLLLSLFVAYFNMDEVADVFSLVLFSSHTNLSLFLPFTLTQSCQKGLFPLCGKFLEFEEIKTLNFQ